MWRLLCRDGDECYSTCTCTCKLYYLYQLEIFVAQQKLAHFVGLHKDRLSLEQLSSVDCSRGSHTLYIVHHAYDTQYKYLNEDAYTCMKYLVCSHKYVHTCM